MSNEMLESIKKGKTDYPRSQMQNTSDGGKNFKMTFVNAKNESQKYNISTYNGVLYLQINTSHPCIREFIEVDSESNKVALLCRGKATTAISTIVNEAFTQLAIRDYLLKNDKYFDGLVTATDILNKYLGLQRNTEPTISNHVFKAFMDIIHSYEHAELAL